MVVLKKYLFIFSFLSNLIFSNFANSNQIFDYETEIFLNNLLFKIKTVNKFEKNIKFYIVKDNNPNAFVVANNKIILSSALIEQSPDYVSLLAVLAHEIGHLQYFHLEKRKDAVEQFTTINLLSNLGLITGSILANKPDALGGVIASQVNINNFYLSFSREQEREADLYSIETLEKLNLPYESVIKILKILESNALSRGFDEEYQKFSTHPIFRERYSFIENKSKNKKFNFEEDIQDNFYFIKAKFMAHNDVDNNLHKLQRDHRAYYNSITYSKMGNLKKSLKEINSLITKYPEYIFLLETKGDILRSHGFINESIKFYKIVLNKFPNNNYIKYKIFLDTDIKNYKINDKNNFFYNYMDLLIHFPKNKYIINRFLQISLDLNKNHWINFFNLINSYDDIKDQTLKEELFKLSEKTNDKKLKKFIYDYLKI